MALTCDDYQTMLAEAEAALHAMLTGVKVSAVQDAGKRVEYSKLSLADLQRYVEDLRNKVAACTGAPRMRRRVFGVAPVDNNHARRRGVF